MRKLFMLTLLTAPLVLQAHEYKAGTLAIDHPWARPTAPRQANGAAYLHVRNSGPSPDRLVGAATEAAGAAELHSHSIDAQGVARMRPVEAVELPAGGEAVLAPGGLHIMLLGLKAPLRDGERLPLTLRFERAGEVRVEIAVERGGAAHGEGNHEAH